MAPVRLTLPPRSSALQPERCNKTRLILIKRCARATISLKSRLELTCLTDMERSCGSSWTTAEFFHANFHCQHRWQSRPRTTQLCPHLRLHTDRYSGATMN